MTRSVFVVAIPPRHNYWLCCATATRCLLIIFLLQFHVCFAILITVVTLIRIGIKPVFHISKEIPPYW